MKNSTVNNLQIGDNFIMVVDSMAGSIQAKYPDNSLTFLTSRREDFPYSVVGIEKNTMIVKDKITTYRFNIKNHQSIAVKIL